MSNDFETSPNIHIYKPKRSTIALKIFSYLFIWIVMGIPLIAFGLMLKSLFYTQSEFISLASAFGCLLTPLIILMGLNIILVTVSTISSFFSYIKISPDGIEQKYAISKHIRCNWSDVDKLGKFFLFTDVIYLNTFEVLGFSLSLKSPFRLLSPKQGFVTLTGYEGWSDGQLANDLKHYAPKLFENQPVSQTMQSENNEEIQPIETSSKSQEIRLLAAISHASVIFTNIGFFIPIGVYLTQKKKSSYLGFQALQALIWQIIMFVFNILTSSCMAGSIFIPVFFATSTQNERLIGLSGEGLFFAVLISVFLITFGNLAFIIYGIIGAVMTYQGKDFRYIFIGNHLERSKGVKSTSST